MARRVRFSRSMSVERAPRVLVRLARALLLGVATLTAGPARATFNGPTRVVIIDSDRDEARRSSVSRLSAELTYAGYDLSLIHI